MGADGIEGALDNLLLATRGGAEATIRYGPAAGRAAAVGFPASAARLVEFNARRPVPSTAASKH